MISSPLNQQLMISNNNGSVSRSFRRKPYLFHQNQIRSSWSGATAAAATAAVAAVSGKSFMSLPLAAAAMVVSVTAYILLDSTVGLHRKSTDDPSPTSDQGATNNHHDASASTSSISSFSSSSSSPTISPEAYWNNGLLYDDPKNDPPTNCSFCKVYRQGPCRPYWRPFEVCMDSVKRQQQQQQRMEQQEASTRPTSKTTHSSSSTTTTSNTTAASTVSQETCAALSGRFMNDCLFYHTSLYELIRLQTLQDTYVDVGEMMQRHYAHDTLWDPTDNATTTDDDDDDDTEQTNSSTTVLNDNDNNKVQRNVQKLLLNDDLYQHVQDCTEWSKALQMDWNKWKQLVQALDWTKTETSRRLLAEEEWLTQRREQEHVQMRPTWWSKAPPLQKEGIEQIVEYMAASNSTNHVESTPPSVPWPLRPQTNATDGSPENAGNDDVEELLMSPQTNDSQAFWQHLQDQPDPLLLELVVNVPNGIRAQNKDKRPRRLQHAYARDAATGRLLGYVAESRHPLSSSPNTKHGQEDRTPATDMDTTFVLNKEGYTSLPIQILPGRTGSIQIYGYYEDVTHDDESEHALLVSPPMRLIDTAFGGKPTSSSSTVEQPTEPASTNPDIRVEDVSDLQQRLEKYQILRNFVKFQQQSQSQAVTSNPPPTARR